MEFASAAGYKINNSPEDRESKKRKYASASELESENNFDNGIKTIKKRTDSILELSSRGCEAEPGDEDAIEVSRASFAFAIDIILEQILGSVDRASLFSCRLVSHKWRAVSTKMLKREEICLRLFVSVDSINVLPTSESSDKHSQRKQPLSKFMSFMNDTYIQGCSLTLDAFPCNALKITDCSLNHPELQTILNAHGKHLRYLYISSRFAAASQCKSNFIKQVEHLLCVQAPNLQRLDFEGLKFKGARSAPVHTVVEIRKQNLQLRRLTVKPASRKVIDSVNDYILLVSSLK